MDRTEELKRQAAVRAAEWIEDGMVLGLGTGSTIRHLLDVIAERRKAGELRSIVGIPTSEATRLRSSELGIPLSTLATHAQLDLTIDGADEVDPNLDLIKGLGGALLREKIVAEASRSLVIIVDESKRVDRLGTRAPLPVEVDPFGEEVHLAFFRSLGAEPEMRRDGAGALFVTDGGHHIFDCRFENGINDAAAVDLRLNARAGIIENGLFLGRAEAVVVAGEAGAYVLERALAGR